MVSTMQLYDLISKIVEFRVNENLNKNLDVV